MVIELKMCRFENVPWGFRLVGGTDFDVPLTVIKVTEASLAEEAGLRVGDIIVRINDEPTINMTHNDAHQVISKCGNTFFFGIIREGLEEDEFIEQEQQQHYQEEREFHQSTQATEIQINQQLQQETTETSISLQTCETIQSSEIQHHTEEVSEEKIAELMSGEAEVLQEHNVIGVNFNRIFPKPGICQSSEVLRELNEEAIKTKMEIEKEKRKWTTFLQKPNRPIPKDKKCIEEQPKTERYKIQIIKQAKPRVAPDRTPTPPPEPILEAESIADDKKEEPPNEEELPELPTDTEVPDLELISKTEDESAEDAKNDEEIILNESQDEKITNDENDHQNEKNQKEVEKIEKTEEERLLEKQLVDVQKQLLALSSLPSTIQATLDAVTKQLSELLPTFKLQPQIDSKVINSSSEKETEPEQTVISSESEGGQQDEQIKIIATESTDIQEKTEIKEDIEEIKEIIQITSTNIAPDANVEEKFVRPPSPSPTFENDIEKNRLDDEQRKLQEELQYKKQKDQMQEELKEELQQRLIRDKRSKRPARAFGPLTPQERPLILPGGRRWRKPKDAYNDEFIAEVLSSQAELIVGSTLGSTYESPRMGYDERHYTFLSIPERLEKRVNFMKYQKPEKKIDLEKSEVYKIIHNMEKEPRRGIQARPPKVLAAEDIINDCRIYYIVPLHHYPELMQQCCDLINSEWSRSDAARMRSLCASCDSLPVNLILTTKRMKRVIAHCKLNSISDKRNSCFLESLVVDEDCRGQGFGKLMVKGAEDYCKFHLQLTTVYLCTMGQGGFYEKLGYEYCPPIVEYEVRSKYWAKLQNSNKHYMRKFL